MKKTVAMLLSVMAVGTTCVAREPLEIKGDRIGETVQQFTEHYPNATCKDESSVARVCTQLRGVSLADVVTDDRACEHQKYACDRQGLQARFHKGRLESITYRFYGMNYRIFCDAFAAKYGKPNHDYEQYKEGLGCSWQQDEVWLSAWGGKVPKRDLEFAVIMLADDTPSKDI
jgi:hypothetical protein